jgi:hypothetical protein
MASLLPQCSQEKPHALCLLEKPEASSVSGKKTAGFERSRAGEPGERPEMPLEMTLFLMVLAAFAGFHVWCCRAGSYTKKPAFRAHFAGVGDWREFILVIVGSCCLVCMGIVTAWGCGAFYWPEAGLQYPWWALVATGLVCYLGWAAIGGNLQMVWRLSQNVPGGMKEAECSAWKYWGLRGFIAAVCLFGLLFVVPLEYKLQSENRILTYWRAMHLTSGVSTLVPILCILAGFYGWFWLTLHGLALFGPDRPRLPGREELKLKLAGEAGKDYLRMFSQEDAGDGIEEAAIPVHKEKEKNGRVARDAAAILARKEKYKNWKVVGVGGLLAGIFLLVPTVIARGVPVHCLGPDVYAIIFLVGLALCCSLMLIETWRFYKTWEELKRLLEFLDRLTLRRTLAVLHGFSWGSVWKMSGNVLEVRYKVISRQLECMNHTIASFETLPNCTKKSKQPRESGARSSLAALLWMGRAGMRFADWYQENYTKADAGDLTSFREFQMKVAAASGTLLTKVLIPEWMKEKGSLLVVPIKEQMDEATPDPPPQSKHKHIRNAEEFVCLNYLAFVQNVLGRLRTMVITIVALFVAATAATSTYPFDPRQALSLILIVLFTITGVVIFKVYAEMHRDATLSHVTNTKPGELGTEFWFKILGVGIAPLLGLMTRVFPGFTDFVFAWLQPGVSTLK